MRTAVLFVGFGLKFSFLHAEEGLLVLLLLLVRGCINVKSSVAVAVFNSRIQKFGGKGCVCAFQLMGFVTSRWSEANHFSLYSVSL
jgi:cytochrome b561